MTRTTTMALLVAAAAIPAAGANTKNVILMVSDGGGYSTHLATEYWSGQKEPYDNELFAHYPTSTYDLRSGPGDLSSNEQDPDLAYDTAKAWDATSVDGPSASPGYFEPVPYPAYFQGYEWLRATAPDSAGTMSSLVTGEKVYGSGINVDGFGDPLVTAAEIAKGNGKLVGSISSVRYNHATPAAGAGAHNISRENYLDLSYEMFGAGVADLIGGAGNPTKWNGYALDQGTVDYRLAFDNRFDAPLWNALNNGTSASRTAVDGREFTVDGSQWQLLTTKTDIVSPTFEAGKKLAIMPEVYSNLQERGGGDFGNSESPGTTPFNANVPILADMTRTSLDYLDDDPDGFFLSIEGGAVDWTMHANQIGRMIEEHLDFNNAVQAVIDYLDSGTNGNDWSNTLLIVTSDHDQMLYGPDSGTIPFQNVTDNGAGNLPGYLWHHSSHGNQLVPAFVRGAGAEALVGVSHGIDTVRGNYIDQTDIGNLLVPTSPVAGPGTIGTRTVASQRTNEVFGPPGEAGLGLLQEWVHGRGNPGNRDGIVDLIQNEELAVPPFRSSDGTSWWTGNQNPGWNVPRYPSEVVDHLNSATDADGYVVRLTGELFVPESGTYVFADGIDDYTYWAVDADQSGVAGDDPTEVIIDDNDWTNLQRDGNNASRGKAYGFIDLGVAAGGEWLAVEFLMGEGFGGDAGVIYWDYDTEGGGLNAADGFPESRRDPIDQAVGESLLIPDTFLRSAGARALESANLIAEITAHRPLEFDISGANDTSDLLAVENPDPDVFTTILDVDGATFHIVATGAMADGDSFQIVDADQIMGTPTIESADPGQTWAFDPATGMVTLGATTARPLQAGDADMDGDFDQLDLVQVQIAAKYLTSEAATWGEGDWNGAPGGSAPGGPAPAGDGVFDTRDIVAALMAGKYNTGSYAAMAALAPELGGVLVEGSTVYVPVPEPSTFLLCGLGLAMMLIRCRSSSQMVGRPKGDSR